MVRNLLVLLSTIFVVVNAFNNHNENHGGYPTWFSKSNHMLLSKFKDVVQPNVTVAKDGSGQFKTVSEAINSYPIKSRGRYVFVVYVKAGIYNEYITIAKNKNNILLYGDGPTKTIITGSKSLNNGARKTMDTATFSTLGKDFIAKSITFENTAGHEAGPAVALHVKGDRSAFFDCGIHGYQDTLYVHTLRQFYRNCEISGTIDFIFGHSTTLIQNSKIIVRMPGPDHGNVVVADGTKDMNAVTGIVLQNCSIMPDDELYPNRLTVKTYLARPWKPYSRAVFINNYLGDLIQPDGFSIWGPNETHTATCYFAEFGSTGPGANSQARVKWSKGLISKDEATKFTAQPWLQANTWLPATGIPFSSGLEA
ncbi:pectinesterase [Trifolium repens]|nr:pectinesterase [Trifolium repens]